MARSKKLGAGQSHSRRQMGDLWKGLRKIAVRCAVAMLVVTISLLAQAQTSETVAGGEFDNIFPPPLNPETSLTIERAGTKLPARPEQLHEKPFVFRVPAVQREKLSNGVRVFSYAVPQTLGFYAIVMVEAGKICDPEDKVGLAELTAHAMRTGGAGNLSADQFDKELDKLGASFSLDVQRDYVRFDLFCLPEKAGRAMELLHLMLTQPRFETKAVEREKALFRERIVREDDDPAELSRREFRKVVYGTTHPLARSPQPDAVMKFTREDVVQFYRQFYTPRNVRIGIASAETTTAQDTLGKIAATWRAGDKTPAQVSRGSVASDKSPAYRGVFLLPKEMEQAFVRIGHIGRPRNPHDQPVVDVLNNILGTGGLTSRLMQRVRTEHGLAYAVGGGVFEDNPAGVFAVVASTKRASAADAALLMKQVIADMLNSPPSPIELDTAKKDATFAFANRFATPADAVVQYMLVDLYGYPNDYLSSYLDAVRSVSAADILAAAHRYIDPDKLTIFVLGKKDVASDLEAKIGRVTLWSSDKETPPRARTK